jgi:hypothetical protein
MFAQNIEIKEALVDKIWVIYGDHDLIEYEFERSGEISVTKNGNSFDGSWRILGSGRLKIKTDFTNNTLEYDFSVPGMLVMKIAGMQNVPFLLFDPKIILDGNLGKHLEDLERKKMIYSAPSKKNDDFEDSFSYFIPFIILIIGIVAMYIFVTLSKPNL